MSRSTPRGNTDRVCRRRPRPCTRGPRRPAPWLALQADRYPAGLVGLVLQPALPNGLEGSPVPVPGAHTTCQCEHTGHGFFRILVQPLRRVTLDQLDGANLSSPGGTLATVGLLEFGLCRSHRSLGRFLAVGTVHEASLAFRQAAVANVPVLVLGEEDRVH